MIDGFTWRYLEVAHVAHRLSVSPEFVRRLIRSGQLKAQRVGMRYRVKPEDLDAYLAAQQDDSDDEQDRPGLHAIAKGA